VVVVATRQNICRVKLTEDRNTDTVMSVVINMLITVTSYNKYVRNNNSNRKERIELTERCKKGLQKEEHEDTKY